MRERPSPRTPYSSPFARGAAGLAAAVLATLGSLSAGIALGATSATPFQLAYMYGTSGPAARRHAHQPRRQPVPAGSDGHDRRRRRRGGRHELDAHRRDLALARRRRLSTTSSSTNPAARPACCRRAGSRTSPTCRRRARTTRPSRRSSATASRRAAAAATTAPTAAITRGADGGLPAARRARARLRPAAGDRHGLRRRRTSNTTSPTGSSSSTPRASRAAAGPATRRTTARRPGDPRRRWRLPPEDLPRHRLPAAGGDRRLLGRADLDAPRSVDRGDGAPRVTSGCGGTSTAPPTPSRAARWRSSSRRRSIAPKATRFLDKKSVFTLAFP